MFARFGLGVRALVYLRSIAGSLKTLAANDDERMRREFGPRRKPRTKVTIETMSLADAEARYQRQLDGNYEDD